TLLSPFPDASLARLEQGTMIIRWTFSFSSHPDRDISLHDVDRHHRVTAADRRFAKSGPELILHRERNVGGNRAIEGEREDACVRGHTREPDPQRTIEQAEPHHPARRELRLTDLHAADAGLEAHASGEAGRLDCAAS